MSTQRLPISDGPVPRRHPSTHIGRVGALAVALGVGTALATCGTAYAQTGDTESATSAAADSSVTSPGADKPSSAPRQPAADSPDTTAPSDATPRRSVQRNPKSTSSRSRHTTAAGSTSTTRTAKNSSRAADDDDKSLTRAVGDDRPETVEVHRAASDASTIVTNPQRVVSLHIGAASPTQRTSLTSPRTTRAATDALDSSDAAGKTLGRPSVAVADLASGAQLPKTPKTPKAPTGAQVMMTLLSWARREIEFALGVATPRQKTLPVEPATTAVTYTALKTSTPVAATTVTGTDVVIDAESMTVSPTKAGTIFKDSSASGQKALLLTSNATVSKTVTTPTSSALVIRARGDQYNGSPSMTVSVDGKAVSTTQVSATTWTDYRIPVDLAAGSHTISIAFTNAATKNGSQGRYLRLDKVTVLASAVTPPPPPPSGTPSTTPPYFQAADWLWKPIGANPTLAANSATWAGYLSAPGEQHIANLYQYGVTLVPASAITSSTPRYDVTLTQPWGSDPFGSYTVPIPVGTKVPPGSDGQIAILDPTTGQAFGLWQAKYDSTTNKWSGSWGGMTTLSGNGVDRSGSATATNIARYAGVVTAAEFKDAVANNTGLNHALFVASDIVGPGYVGPATKSDGTNLAGVAVPMPEGYRIQLDPSINVDAIPGITPGEKVIAKTLQTYGAYVGDQGDARLSVAFEAVPDATASNPGAVWVNSGLAWDYYDMSHIPWSGLRVLAPTTAV